MLRPTVAVCLVIAIMTAPASPLWPGSQGNQDAILLKIFEAIGTTNRVAVEFGFVQFQSGSNTWRMREEHGTRNANLSAAKFGPWAALLMGTQIWRDMSTLKYKVGVMRTSVRKTWISSSNIVGLFERHRVPVVPDYVSIDLDTSDLFVLRAILMSKFQPRVISVEYNSNFDEHATITHPDPEVHRIDAWEHSLGAEHRNRKNYTDAICYMGSSAKAIALVAERYGYVVVAATRGLDLFLVRRDVWGGRAVPTLGSLPLHQCVNKPMTPEMAVNLLDYRILMNGTNGSMNHTGRPADTGTLLCRARAAAAHELRKLAHKSPCKCFKHLRNLTTSC